jgi:hypothetical protein
MRTLLVSPQAGMCNRFRALGSALLLARLSGRRLHHCWMEETPQATDIEIIRDMRTSSWDTFFVEDTAIPFHAVDATTAIDQVFSEWGPGEFWYAAQSSAIQRCRWNGIVHIERTSADALLRSEAGTVLLETSLSLKPSCLTPAEYEEALSAIYQQHFRPLPQFQDVVENFLRHGPYVGVHIRRRDLLQHVPAANISLASWERLIRLNVSSSEALYISSDDGAFVKDLATRLTYYEKVPVDQTFSHTPRLQAFIEFLCLSKATRVYGTVGASFSREAARFGGAPFLLCATTQPDTPFGRVLNRLGMGRQLITCTELPGPSPGGQLNLDQSQI